MTFSFITLASHSSHSVSFTRYYFLLLVILHREASFVFHSVHEYAYREHNDLRSDGKSERSHSQQIHADREEEELLREMKSFEEYGGIVSLYSS